MEVRELTATELAPSPGPLPPGHTCTPGRSTGVQTAGAHRPSGTSSALPQHAGDPHTGRSPRTEQGPSALLGQQKPVLVWDHPESWGDRVTGFCSARLAAGRGSSKDPVAEGLLPGTPWRMLGVKSVLSSVRRSSHLSGRPEGCGHVREQGEAYLRAARGGECTAGAGGLRAAGLPPSDPPSRGEMPQPALCASFYPQSVIAALSGCEGKREGERAGGRAGEGGGLGEGAAGRGQLRKAGSQASQAGSDWTGLWAFFLKTHARAHTHTCTRTHTHTHSFPHLSSAFPLWLFFHCWPRSPPESARGAPARTALGRGSGREGPAGRPKIRPQPRPEWPGPRPCGWAPGPVWGDRPAVPCLCPHPSLPDSFSTPRPGKRQPCPKLGTGVLVDLGSRAQASIRRGRGPVGRMAGKVRSCWRRPVGHLGKGRGTLSHCRAPFFVG